MFCPLCWLEILALVVLAVSVLPVLAFLGKVCKIQWANRAYNWCIVKMKKLKFWKKKEKSTCTEGCEKEEK